MSPILVRPVREQFEHDRVIRVLQARYKRKYEVVINPGAEQNASVEVGELAMYPDLVLFSQERSRKMQGTVEVETVESINTLEAMAEWGPFSRLRAAFFLYVPANTIDTVRRLCADYSISPAEIWTYHVAIDQVRFTMVHRSPDAPRIPEPRAERSRPEVTLPPKNDPAAASAADNSAAARKDDKEPGETRSSKEAATPKPTGKPRVGATSAVRTTKKAPVKKPVTAKAKGKTARPAATAAKKGTKKVAAKAAKPASAKKRR